MGWVWKDRNRTERNEIEFRLSCPAGGSTFCGVDVGSTSGWLWGRVVGLRMSGVAWDCGWVEFGLLMAFFFGLYGVRILRVYDGCGWSGKIVLGRQSDSN
ncbi:hypothetical protein BDQ94DRAFT_151630 [Aspergillus welwitschiae]|uniref:Transmembrane protein n=1 Tax=Aspergillus welwitschiae TaxID=1341132 RepID=A0A3F3PPD9_9EURO|nr:hypothetical protein BDQ94DRAFT_151630 [Aspergillus welwitschiae]RDH28820.1 hypothetical protein BDQ94DRAFT_151630 [Aspergillus welwitschiae]